MSVYNVPELSTKSRLGNSGDVYLPLIDYVHLAGLTIEEAQALIEKGSPTEGSSRIRTSPCTSMSPLHRAPTCWEK